MNELEFQEEWLSAYLDDELTAEQRQVVEQRLAIDPAAQATLEDLQRVRAMVAKLPRWSGADLNFTIPAELPGSFADMAEGELDDDLDDELDDFEEVPRSLAGGDEPQMRAATNTNWNSQSRLSGPMLRWISLAASVLLVVGLGYVYWPPAGLQVAKVDSKNATALPAAIGPVGPEAGLVSGLGRPEMNSLGDEVLDRASSVTSLSRGGGGQGGRGLAENSDPAPFNDFMPALPAAAVALSAAETRDAERESKIRVAESLPTLGSSPGGGGFGGLASAADEALGKNLPPVGAVPGLPVPTPRSMAPSESAGLSPALADDSMKEELLFLQKKANAPAVFFARSQSWNDAEAQTSLQSGANLFGVHQLANGNNAYAYNIAKPTGADQKLGETATTESVLMAAIKPEIANSPEFFPTIVASNQLLAVDQLSVLDASSVDARAGVELLPSGDLGTNGQPGDPSAANAPRSGSTDAPVKSDAFMKQRFQFAMPSAPQGNSFVLFVNRDEATRILTQLQDKGQIASQVWRVLQQPAKQAADNGDFKIPAIDKLQRTPDLQAARKAQAPDASEGTAEPNGNDKVILMLNGPPK